jgi:hypothetical protein
MTAQLDGLPADELRAMIRAVLRDVLPATIGRVPGAAAANGAAARPPAAVPPTPPSGLPPATAAAPAEVVTPAGVTPATMRTTAAATPAATRTTAARVAATTRQVRLETEADLREFALEIVRLADNPARRRDLLTGRLTFTLARRDGEAAPTSEHRIETGAVTERAVQSAAKAGQRLVLGPRAVLTPLARDRALALGVPIERER